MHAFTKISSEFHELFQTVHHIRKTEKGTFLFQEGTPAIELFVVLSGKVQICKMIPDGRELTIRMCSEGDLIGELSLFYPGEIHLLNAKVIEDGKVAVILRDELEEKLGDNHEIALEYIKWLSHQHRKAQTKFRDLVLHGKKGALYSTLIRLSNSYGIQGDEGIIIDTPLTNQDIANFCGTSREVVNRLLSDLRKNKVITMDKGMITIHNIRFLRKEMDCENCPVDICNIE